MRGHRRGRTVDHFLQDLEGAFKATGGVGEHALVPRVHARQRLSHLGLSAPFDSPYKVGCNWAKAPGPGCASGLAAANTSRRTPGGADPPAMPHADTQTPPAAVAPPSLQVMADAIRVLAMDAVVAAHSGHPGMPMGMADVATVLWTKHLKFDAADPAGRTATASCCPTGTAPCCSTRFCA